MKLPVALLGPGAAWAFHLLGSYAIVGIGCLRPSPATGLMLAVTTVVCAMAAVAAGVMAYASGRRALANTGPDTPHGLLMIVGAFLGGLFALVILVAGTSSLFVPLCPASR